MFFSKFINTAKKMDDDVEMPAVYLSFRKKNGRKPSLIVVCFCGDTL